MSENGEIYTAGKNFTLPPAVTAWTNSISVKYLLKEDKDKKSEKDTMTKATVQVGAESSLVPQLVSSWKRCSFENHELQANIRIVVKKNLAKSNVATTGRNPPNTSFHDVHSWWYKILYFCSKKKNLLLDNLLIFPFLWFAIVMEWGKIQEPSYTKECNKFIKTTEFCHLQYLQGLSKDLKNQVS